MTTQSSKCEQIPETPTIKCSNLELQANLPLHIHSGYCFFSIYLIHLDTVKVRGVAALIDR